LVAEIFPSKLEESVMKRLLAAFIAYAALGLVAPATAAAKEQHGHHNHHGWHSNDHDYHGRHHGHGDRYNNYGDQRHHYTYDDRRYYDNYGRSAAIIIRGYGGELVVRANDPAWGQLLGGSYNWCPDHIYHYDRCHDGRCRIGVYDRWRGRHVGWVHAPPPPRD
jgi:hypothetical protein